MAQVKCKCRGAGKDLLVIKKLPTSLRRFKVISMTKNSWGIKSGDILDRKFVETLMYSGLKWNVCIVKKPYGV